MDNRVKKLFEKYQSGQANDQERKIVEDWFASFEKTPIEKLNTKEDLELLSHMDEKINSVLLNHPRNLFDRRWLYAAAALILIPIGIWWLKYYQTESKQNVTVTYTTVVVSKGAKKKFSLPDGSMVSLNSDSRILIPSNFGIKTREIFLAGEAFFSITHNEAKPFTIHSGKLLITDLGTEFDVKAYPEDHKIRVAVKSGKVKVEKNNADSKPETFADAITHNQQLMFEEQTNIHTLSRVETSDLISWQQNKLSFQSASMDEIASTLERWYNVTIKLNGEKTRRLYTVSFNNEPLDHVLNVLNRLTGLHYQIKNKIVLINLKKL
ncbi:FecR family protein [Mucilaginibacter sp. SG564]|uniref:FecR family protein n=1 Tax=Mucilaginibacter sp. SG564 TaxID=2587022 RepID=UPI001556B379|nr:ferric-dicitrate binding protein FerR (iron transport regulator) [Mucilaginibacter sp. SG564]